MFFLPQQTAKRRLFVCEEISATNGKFFEINGKFFEINGNFFKSMGGIYCTVTHKNLQLGSNWILATKSGLGEFEAELPRFKCKSLTLADFVEGVQLTSLPEQERVSPLMEEDPSSPQEPALWWGSPWLSVPSDTISVLASTGSSMGGLIRPPLNLEGLGSWLTEFLFELPLLLLLLLLSMPWMSLMLFDTFLLRWLGLMVVSACLTLFRDPLSSSYRDALCRPSPELYRPQVWSLT